MLILVAGAFSLAIIGTNSTISDKGMHIMQFVRANVISSTSLRSLNFGKRTGTISLALVANDARSPLARIPIALMAY